MASRNPFRWSKGKLFLYTSGLTVTWLIMSALFASIPNSVACSAPFLIIGLFYGAIFGYKVYRDVNAAHPSSRVNIYEHEATTRIGQPKPPAIQSADSNKLELFGPPTDL